MKYPISPELHAAIHSLFEDPSVGLSTLRATKPTFPENWYQEGPGASIPIEKRAALLKRKLETYVINMAAQHEEYGCEEETKRLQAETVATLIALRELYAHLPEAFEENSGQ